MAELSDRSVRSKNIIITGLMETNISNYKDRKEAEKREVLGLLKKDLKRLYRTKKYNTPGKVCASHATPTQNQTPQQQSFYKKLKEELKHRKDNGEMNLAIKYNKGLPKIVKIKPKN
ncbi:unnamed protein product [Parnassius apollo]|uniref:(apollo) hypothetical protein n=1 Tax=Parnassius apollo TaxID=110799 RepID=A0A8S3XX07_PARAO|nr:unnamed protein product [Parnassius apollo]